MSSVGYVPTGTAAPDRRRESRVTKPFSRAAQQVNSEYIHMVQAE